MSGLEDIDDPSEQASRVSDVYVFYEDTEGLVGGFDPGENPEYRFLADMDTSGGWNWSSIAIIELANFYTLTKVANRVLPNPVDPDAAKPVLFGASVLRRTKHFPYFGFARLQVTRGRAPNVLRAIGGDHYSGSALVSGTFALLAELGGDSPDEVEQAFAELDGIPDVVERESGQVQGRYFYRRPEETEGGFYEVGETPPP